MTKHILLSIFLLSPISAPALSLKHTTHESVQFFNRLKKNIPQEQSIPLVKLYFMWTSGCDYCEDSYRSLLNLSNTQSKNSFKILSICLDEEETPLYKQKIKEMSAFPTLRIKKSDLNPPSAMQKWPLFIVEDTKLEELDIYSGFSNERLLYVKNQVERIMARTKVGAHE